MHTSKNSITNSSQVDCVRVHAQENELYQRWANDGWHVVDAGHVCVMWLTWHCNDKSLSIITPWSRTCVVGLMPYLKSIDTFYLFRTVFEIFGINVFRVWLWPLSYRDHPRSKIFSPFESPYMTSYLIFIDTFSLFRTVFEIYNIKVYRVWLWPSTFRGHPRSKIFSTFESPYIIIIIIITLSTEVSERSNCRLVPYWREFLGVSGSRTWLPI